MNQYDKTQAVRLLLKQTGLQDILDLDGITEIAVNAPQAAWFDRGNGWESKPLPELTFERCERLAKALCVYAGITKTLGVETSLASVILPEGERGQIAVPPATLTGIISLTIRKPSTARFTLDDYEQSGRFATCKNLHNSSEQMALTDTQNRLLALKEKARYGEFFKLAIESNLNILLVGGTGSGKTTVMKALVDNYALDKRLFTIEDVHELDLPNHPNHLHLFYKQGGLTPKQIIESCMRMKPDHVLLAELRGDEAWGYLEMLNTGHQGSVTTIHANDCLSANARLATLVKQSDVGKTLDHEHIMKTINSSIDVTAYFKGTHLIELMFDPVSKNKILSGD